jgi:HEAT repeat protein
MANTRVGSLDFLSEEEKESSVQAEEISSSSFSPDVRINPVEKKERDLCAANSSGCYSHRVFISHRGTRKQNIAFPMMAIFSYFCGPEFAVFDRVTFEPGEENRTIISEKLSQSLHCLVIISKDFFQSKWTVKEVDAFFKAIEENSDNPKKRKIIPLFIGLSPADCRSLKKSDCEIPGQPLSEEHFQRCQKVAERLSRFGGLQQHAQIQVPGESVRDFILNQMPVLLRNYLRDGDEPSLLPDFEDRIHPVLLAYIYDEAVSYYQRISGEVNITNLLGLIMKLRLQASLRAHYAEYHQLERLFDNRPAPIVDSFINLALIKETEHKQKEQGLGRGANLEEKEENQKEFRDERMASHEELYAVKEPLALNHLFEPKDDTKTPHKILILGRAGIGKTILCQYLAVQWASNASEYKDEEPREELGNYLRQKFEAVFWIRLREVAAGSPRHNTVAKVINQFCLRGSNKPSLQELDFYITSQNKRILFILDGYDEVTDSIEQAHGVHLKDFLNEIVNYQNILVTSRPLAIDALGQSKIKFDRKLENIGFTNENIEMYVRHFMRDSEKLNQTEPMLKFLRIHPSIWGIAHIPINLELLSWLWSQGDLELAKGEIKTLSKLYQTIVDRVQHAYIKKSTPFRASLLDASLENENKEEGLSSSDLANDFLEYLAYEAMQHESLLILKNQLKKALSKTLKKHHKPSSLHHQEIVLKSATDRLGFLRSTREGGRSQLDQTHYFIHLSFQEFYAASYIKRILSEPIESEEQITIIEHIRTEKYMPRYQLMLWMAAGLLYQQGVEKGRDFSVLEQFWKAILSEPRDLIGFHHLILVMHCLEEGEADDQLPLHKVLIEQQVRWFDNYTRRSHYKHQSQALKDKYVNELIHCPVLQSSELMVNHMLKNLRSNSDYNIKYLMVYAFGHLQNPSEIMIAALVNALKKEAFEEGEAYALGCIKNTSEIVLTALENAVKDQESELTQGKSSKLDQFQNLNEEVVIMRILNALKDEHWFVRYKAINVLRQRQPQNLSEAVITALIDALKDERWAVREQAIQALGELSNPTEAVITAFLDALKDENSSVRFFTEQALGRLLKPNKAVITAFLDALKEENSCVNFFADQPLLGRLSYHNEAITTILLNGLKDKECGVRCSVIRALAGLPNPPEAVITVLLHTLKNDEEDNVRQEANRFLCQIQYPSELVINVLLNALKDENNYVKYVVAYVLGDLQNPSDATVASLLNALEDKNKYVKYAAAYALGKLQNPSDTVMTAFFSALKDEDAFIRFNTVTALSWLPSNSSEAVITAFVNTLKNDKESSVRENTASLLGKIQNPSEVVIAALLNALKDEESSVRKEAASGLGKIQNPSKVVIAALLNALKDEESSVRKEAASGLGKLQNPDGEVIMALLNALKDKKWDVENAASSALDKFQNMSEVVIPVFLNVLKDEEEDNDVKYNAIKALGRFKNPGASVIHTLLDVLEKNKDKSFRTKISGEERINNVVVGVLSHLNTSDIAIVFERLIDRLLLPVYLSIYFNENHLLCINYEKEEVILSLYNKTHKISFSREILIHLEGQIRTVAEEHRYPLDIILLDEKKIHIGVKNIPITSQPDSNALWFISSNWQDPSSAYEESASTSDLGDLLEDSAGESDLENSSTDSEMQFDLATYYLKQNDLDKAIEHYIRNIQNQNNPLSWEAKKIAYNNLACCYHVKGQFDEAEQYFLRALEQEPTASTYSEYSLLLMHQSRFLEAIPLLEKAIEQENDGSSLYYGLLEKRLLDKYLQLEVTEEKNLNIYNPTLIAYYQLVRCYQALNQFHQVQTCLAQFTEWVKQERSPLSYRLLLYTHQFLGNAKEVKICQIILEELAIGDPSQQRSLIDTTTVSKERLIEKITDGEKEPLSPFYPEQKEEISQDGIREEAVSTGHPTPAIPHVEEISHRELASYSKQQNILNHNPTVFISSNAYSYWNKYKKPLSIAVSAAVVGMVAIYMAR